MGEDPYSLAHALTAILRHNLTAQNVDIRREPLTLLLMLCDHLQEWGRPRLAPDPLARGVMESLRFSTQMEFAQKIRAHELLVEGLEIVPRTEETSLNGAVLAEVSQGDPRLQLVTRIGEHLLFRLRFESAREADFEPAISWLWLCRDLQFLGSQDEELPYDVVIEFEHKPSRLWRELPWKPLEMDLLETFAREQRPYLLKWIQTARDSKNDEGIYYEGNHRSGEERFWISLNRLAKPLPRGLSVEDWIAYFNWKWRELGRRMIDGTIGF